MEGGWNSGRSAEHHPIGTATFASAVSYSARRTAETTPAPTARERPSISLSSLVVRLRAPPVDSYTCSRRNNLLYGSRVNPPTTLLRPQEPSQYRFEIGVPFGKRTDGGHRAGDCPVKILELRPVPAVVPNTLVPAPPACQANMVVFDD